LGACQKNCSSPPPPPPPPTGKCKATCDPNKIGVADSNYADQAIAFIKAVNAATTTKNKITCVTVDGEQNGDYGSGLCALAAAASTQGVKLTDVGLAHSSTINSQALACDTSKFGIESAAYPEFYWVGELGAKSDNPSDEKCYNCPQACKFKFSPRYSCETGTCKPSASGPFQKMSDCAKSCGKQCMPDVDGKFTDKYCGKGCAQKVSPSPIELMSIGSHPRAGAASKHYDCQGGWCRESPTGPYTEPTCKGKCPTHFSCMYPPDECTADQIDRCSNYCANTIYDSHDPEAVAANLVLNGVSAEGISCIQDNSQGKTWPMFSIEMLNNPFKNGKPTASCIQTKYGGNSCGTFNGFGSWSWPEFQKFLDAFYAKTKAPQMAVYEWQFVPPTWMNDGIKVQRGSRPYKLALWHEGVVGTAKDPTTFLQYAQEMANFVRDKAFDRVILCVMDPTQFDYSSVGNVAKWVDMMPEGVEICAQVYIDTKDANWAFDRSIASSDDKCKAVKEGTPLSVVSTTPSPPQPDVWKSVVIIMGIIIGIIILIVVIWAVFFQPKQGNQGPPQQQPSPINTPSRGSHRKGRGDQ